MHDANLKTLGGTVQNLRRWLREATEIYSHWKASAPVKTPKKTQGPPRFATPEAKERHEQIVADMSIELANNCHNSALSGRSDGRGGVNSVVVAQQTVQVRRRKKKGVCVVIDI